MFPWVLGRRGSPLAGERDSEGKNAGGNKWTRHGPSMQLEHYLSHDLLSHWFLVCVLFLLVKPPFWWNPLAICFNGLPEANPSELRCFTQWGNEIWHRGWKDVGNHGQNKCPKSTCLLNHAKPILKWDGQPAVGHQHQHDQIKVLILFSSLWGLKSPTWMFCKADRVLGHTKPLDHSHQNH